MKCPKCGHENQDYSMYCGMCGGDLEKEGVPSTTSAEPSQDAMKCPNCGNDSPRHVNFCCYCGKSFGTTAASGVCPKCGVLNAPGLAKCGNCGELIVPLMPQPVAVVSRTYMKKCKWCDRDIPIRGGDLCWECASGTDSYSASVSVRTESSGLLVAAGILLMIAGVLAIGQGLLYLVAGSMVASLGYSVGPVVCCGLLDLLFGIGSIGGGIFAVKQNGFLYAIVGSVCALLSLGFVIGSLFGLLGLIFIAVSKDDFAD